MKKMNRKAEDGRSCRARRVGMIAGAALLLSVVGIPGGAVLGDSPDLTIGSKEYPNADAVILRWEQHYTLKEDGSVSRRDHRWMKLLTRRPIRAHADPRVAYHTDEDKLVIHKAQTILPDGSTLRIPDYSFNPAGPDDIAGWPVYAAWEDVVISFSGIVDNCVLELDYEIITKPGVIPWLEDDIRVNDDYPVVERVIKVSVPEDVTLLHRVDGTGSKGNPEASSFSGPGSGALTWTFKNVPGSPGEPQSLPWQQRNIRLRFTTCTGVDEFVTTLLGRVESAAKSDAKVKAFAEGVIEQESDAKERVSKVCKKLHDSFNFVTTSKATRSLSCRSAAEVFQANYGNSLESAGLLSAMLSALGLEVKTAVAVDADTWTEDVPTLSSFAGVVVRVDGDEPLFAHPSHGLLRDPGSWGGYVLLLKKGSTIEKRAIRRRGEESPSEVTIAGKISIDEKGQATADLRIDLTGAFYDPEKLDSAKSQNDLVKEIADRVFSDTELKSHTITMLSEERLSAKAGLTSKETLKRYERRYVLQLGHGPAFLAEFPMPLGRSDRQTDVHLNGRFKESVDLTIELPEDWLASITPLAVTKVSGNWGAAEQRVEVDGRFVHLRRTVAVASDTVAPNDFASLREVVNTLRTDAAGLLAAGPAK
ncbi:MAG: DUF3857 domain-containing protein [Planctomycetota bacterium]